MPQKGRNKVFRSKQAPKQSATVVFRWENARWKVWPTFLDYVNQQARYGACI